jgi:hypothetical protein
MFCPHCGQPTPNDGLRFCRQCGFRLDGVSQLLANGGTPLLAQPIPYPAADSPRRKGLKIGLKLTLVSLVMFPLVLGFAIGIVRTPVPLFLPFTVFLAGVARMIYARLVEDDRFPYAPPLMPVAPVVTMPTHPQQTVQAASSAAHQPRALFAKGTNTNELPQQRSVTEQTTGLLKR